MKNDMRKQPIKSFEELDFTSYTRREVKTIQSILNYVHMGLGARQVSSFSLSSTSFTIDLINTSIRSIFNLYLINFFFIYRVMIEGVRGGCRFTRLLQGSNQVGREIKPSQP